jgi:hypothetical protein
MKAHQITRDHGEWKPCLRLYKQRYRGQEQKDNSPNYFRPIALLTHAALSALRCS